jgi:hypothetical protein
MMFSWCSLPLIVDGQGEALPNLVELLARDEVVRYVTEIFCLERLAANDIITAHSLLASMVQVMSQLRAGPYFE